jgi:hypothetical protein
MVLTDFCHASILVRSLMDMILNDPTAGHLESHFSNGRANLEGEWHVLS